MDKILPASLISYVSVGIAIGGYKSIKTVSSELQDYRNKKHGYLDLSISCIANGVCYGSLWPVWTSIMLYDKYKK